MRTAHVISTLALGVLCLVWPSWTAFGEEMAAVPTKPLLVLTGADSRLEKPAYHRITSEEAWKKLWLSHLGKTEADVFRESIPIVNIDFDRCMVIAVFQGEKTNSRGLTVISLEEGKDAITLRFDDMSYQTFGGVVRVKPYAFVVVQKSAKIVVVEEDVQSLKDKPPEWKERARLKAEAERGKR